MVDELSFLRVLDVSESIGGAYCAKLFGDAGADVVKAERPGGDPMRSWSCAGPGSVEDGALFAYLHHGHRSVVVDDDDQIRRLAGESDIIIADPAGPGPGPLALAAAEPEAVVVSITPYGLTGPFAGRPGSELTVQADGGALAIRGHPRRPPFQAGGQVTEWVAGVYGAAGALAAALARRRGIPGVVVDVSWAEAASLSCTLFSDLNDSIGGRSGSAERPVARSLETPSIEPTADGYVGFNTNTQQQFSDFLVLIGRTDLLEDPSWAGLGTRIKRFDEWNEIVHAFTTQHATEEIVERAALLRIPVSPVGDAESIMAVDHLVARDSFVDDPTGSFKMPRCPWRIDGDPGAVPGPAPRLGEPGGTLEARARAPRPTGRPPGGPMEGLRILDLTTWWAGPAASGFLAALGADVIHVESCGHPDGMRMTAGAFFQREGWWEMSAFFLSINANKRGITLDLSTDEGRDLLLRLVAESDVVMENFTPRVMERFDLGWDVVHATNPGALMVRMPAFGLDGPWRDRPGFAQTMEQLTGLAWVTGYPDDSPRIQRGPCDPNAGLHAAFATMVALCRRQRTGEGCLVEAPMVDAALAIAAETFIEWTAYGERLGRDGNRSPRACPQGVYPCRDEETWLALSVLDDEQWRALVGALGEPVWAKDPEFSTLGGRRRRQDELDDRLAAWARSREVSAAVECLVTAGVPAAEAWDPRRVSEHPQFVARAFFEEVDHVVAGRHGTPTLPLRYGEMPRWIRAAAPTLGEHNQEVLGELGLDATELAHLERSGVIGTRPRGL